MARRATSGEVRLIRVLADTDVLLDVLLARQPWLPESAALWQAHEDGQINMIVTPNVPDFRSAPMPVLTPAELQARLSPTEES
jgi:hypothetical protein